MKSKLDPQIIKDQNKKVFDEIAPLYDTNRFFDISANHLVNHFVTGSHDTMLDLTSGTGSICIKIAQKYPHIKITSIDQSIGMLNQAKKKAKKAGIDRIKFICQDAEIILIPPNSFDLITCGYGLFFFTEMEEMFANIFKLLRPDGSLIFSTFSEEAFQPCTDLFLNLLGEFDVKIPKMSRGRLNSVEKIDDLCHFAGVTKYTTAFLEIRYEISVEDWWDLLNSAGYKGLLKQIEPERLDDFRQQHMYELEKELKGSKLILNADTIYGIVRK